MRWGESSLRNGFGLKFLHKFFNVPFLTLQRQSLLQQLDINQRDILATQQELDVYMETEEADYRQFSDRLINKRREAAEQVAPKPSASILAGQPSNVVDVSKTQFSAPTSQISFSNRSAPASKDPSPSNRQTVVKSSPTKVDMDSFVPDDADFDNFLDETDSARSAKPSNADNNEDTSDDEDAINPMVAKFNDDEDDVDIDTYTAPVVINNVKDLSDDSDNENIKAQNGVLHDTTDALNDFLNDGDEDLTVKSVHQDYESF